MQHEDKITEVLIELGNIKTQLNRLIADAESEKEVRRDRNKEIDRRLAELEKWQAKWGGALIALGIVATIVSLITAFIKFT